MARSSSSPTPGSGEGGCHVSEIFATLGRAHTLDILHLFLSRQPRSVRFIDIQESLRLSPNTVSERLKTLVRAGLLARTVYHEVPPRVEYSVTPKLLDLTPVFASLTQWSRSNNLREEPAAAGKGLAIPPPSGARRVPRGSPA